MGDQARGVGRSQNTKWAKESIPEHSMDSVRMTKDVNFGVCDQSSRPISASYLLCHPSEPL